LEEISPQGIQALAKVGTVAVLSPFHLLPTFLFQTYPYCQVLLPSTAYILRLKSPPARQLIGAGVPVALGSDFNPNAHCLAMPTVMNLACVLFGLSMPEALVAATLHAAHSLGRGQSHGAIAV
jgi:imidazolonepropionase